MKCNVNIVVQKLEVSIVFALIVGLSLNTQHKIKIMVEVNQLLLFRML